MRVNSRLQAVGIYLRRVLNWQLNNSPFLSGDTFSDIADANFSRSRFRLRDLRVNADTSEVIFVAGNDFEDLLSKLDSFPLSKVIIVGNSDRDWKNFSFVLPPRIKRIYLQNNYVDSPLIYSLPIGLENRKLGVNGLISNFKKAIKNQQRIEICCEKPLLTQISPTHEGREELLSKVDAFHYIEKRLSPDDYLKQLSRHNFIICPRGNGVDTHRFWESLYLNAYPVVLKSAWSQLIREQLGVPLIEVESWDKTIQILNSSDLKGFSSLEIPSLWINHWKTKFKSDL